MYRELHSLRQALHHELEGTLTPLPGVEPNKLLQTYLDQLTLYVGVDVADQTATLLALNANKEELDHLLDYPNTPKGQACFRLQAKAPVPFHVEGNRGFWIK